MSTVRLWDKDANLLATQGGCGSPGSHDIAIDGLTAFTSMVRELLPTLVAEKLYVTVDLEPAEYMGGAPRRGGPVSKIDVEQRPCECTLGTVLTTTIGWL